MKKTRQQGFTLLECMVYIAVLVVVLGFSIDAFLHYWDQSRAFDGKAKDVIRVLQVGDQWRADIRSARGKIQFKSNDSVEQLEIPVSAGQITYSFAKGELRREEKVVLTGLQSSRMKPELDLHVPAWRWQVEFQSKRRNILWRPLFTFEAVAGLETNR